MVIQYLVNLILIIQLKKISILKYVVKESEFLTQDEYDSISWPGSDATQVEIDAFWDNETNILVSIVEDKDVIEVAKVLFKYVIIDKIDDINKKLKDLERGPFFEMRYAYIFLTVNNLTIIMEIIPITAIRISNIAVTSFIFFTELIF